MPELARAKGGCGGSNPKRTDWQRIAKCALAEQIGQDGHVPRRDETRSEPVGVWAALQVPVGAWGERRRRGRCSGGDDISAARLGKGE